MVPTQVKRAGRKALKAIDDVPPPLSATRMRRRQVLRNVFAHERGCRDALEIAQFARDNDEASVKRRPSAARRLGRQPGSPSLSACGLATASAPDCARRCSCSAAFGARSMASCAASCRRFRLTSHGHPSTRSCGYSSCLVRTTPGPRQARATTWRRQVTCSSRWSMQPCAH